MAEVVLHFLCGSLPVVSNVVYRLVKALQDCKSLEFFRHPVISADTIRF